MDQRDLQIGKVIYLYLSSQRKPSYGGYKIWILIQGSDKKQKWSFFTNAEEAFAENFAPFLKKINTMEINVKIFIYDNSGEKKTFEAITQNKSKKLNLDLPHQALHSKIGR